MKSETDLIALKTKESADTPALLLGLDGWILRSIKKEFRNQFLAGYERLLRVAFHPDRYTDPQQKLSRQNYLQVINESVRMMMDSELFFELSTDSVPTKRNPMIRLQEAVDIRDSIIERANAQMEERSASFKEDLEKEQSKVQVLRRRVESLQAHRDLLLELRLTQRGVAAGFQVPIGFRKHEVKGHFWEFDATQSKLFWITLEEYSRKGISRDGEWYKSGRWLEEMRGQLGKEKRLKFNRTLLQPGMPILGALSIPTLCRFIAWHRRVCANSVNQEVIDKSLRFLTEPPTDQLAWTTEVRPFLFSYYAIQDLLLIGPESGSKRLFLVETSDAAQNPKDTMVKGLFKDLQKANRDYLEQRAETEKLRARNGLLSSETDVLKKTVRRLSKEVFRLTCMLKRSKEKKA